MKQMRDEIARFPLSSLNSFRLLTRGHLRRPQSLSKSKSLLTLLVAVNFQSASTRCNMWVLFGAVLVIAGWGLWVESSSEVCALGQVVLGQAILGFEILWTTWCLGCDAALVRCCNRSLRNRRGCWDLDCDVSLSRWSFNGLCSGLGKLCLYWGGVRTSGKSRLASSKRCIAACDPLVLLTSRHRPSMTRLRTDLLCSIPSGVQYLKANFHKHVPVPQAKLQSQTAFDFGTPSLAEAPSLMEPLWGLATIEKMCRREDLQNFQKGGFLRALFWGFTWHETPIKLVFFKGEVHETLRFLRFREIEFWRLSLIEGLEPKNCSKPAF